MAWGTGLRIGIIGCGIAGQAAAIALARTGHDVTVVERFPEARPLGSGLLLQPSGQEALARLGLLDDALSWGERIERLYGRTPRHRMVMDLRYGALGDGIFGLGIHRAALFDCLHRGLKSTTTRLILAFEVAAIETRAAPMLVARDGRREGPFDLILDCAGTHDALREAFPSPPTAPIYPWGALWTTCRDTTGAFGTELRQVYRGPGVMLGMLPVGRVPGAPPDERHVAFFWSLKLTEFEKLRAEGLPALKARMLDAWPEAAPIVNGIARFEDLSLATYRDVRLRPWHAGRVLAIGDAAHGTSPQLGQGANLALIDAVVLAEVLGRSKNTDDAIADYERARRSHVKFYQLGSRFLTPFFQSDIRALGFLRDLLLGPLGRLPMVDHVMRTTLAGVRRFPFGLYQARARSAQQMQPAAQPDGHDVARIAQEQQ